MKKIIYLSIALIFAITISKAQSVIPNPGFESWTNMGSYEIPDQWGTMNNATSAMSVYTATRATPGNPGTAYLKLTSKTVGASVVNGIAVSGVLDVMTMQPVSGFPYNMRPASFTGKWQHMIFGSSQGSISVTLTRWDANSNQRVNVATANQTLSGMAMSWANFTLNFTYTDGNNPDTCIIVLKASGTAPTDQDYLWVDNLAFSGLVTGIETNNFSSNISVYPIPALDNLTVNLSALQEKYVSVQITDMQGKTAMSLNKIEVSSNASIDISGLQKGNYILEILAASGTGKINFVKQ